MSRTNFPSGFPSGYSVQGFPSVGASPVNTTGTIIYVDSSNGANGNNGLDVNNAKATIDNAIGATTANKGDVILVMPNHAENISSATSLVADVAGVSIIGLGTGRNRPVLTFTATAGSIELDAADVRISNIVFFSSISAVVVGINVDAANVMIDNCEFNFDATGDDFITMIDVDAVNETVISNCAFYAEETAGCAEAIRLDTANRAVVQNNWFTGNFSDAAIIGEGAASLSVLLKDNLIYNEDTTTGNGIDLNVACTGAIVGNRIGTLFSTNITGLLDPGSCLCSDNLAANAVDESGATVPTTASA